MPLARIFTHHPERTAALSSQLQQQGYTVEVASPDQLDLVPADLEIEFELCERADVLERAAGLADEFQADIAVAPGVIQAATPVPAVAPLESSIALEAPAAVQEHACVSVRLRCCAMPVIDRPAMAKRSSRGSERPEKIKAQSSAQS